MFKKIALYVAGYIGLAAFAVVAFIAALHMVTTPPMATMTLKMAEAGYGAVQFFNGTQKYVEWRKGQVFLSGKECVFQLSEPETLKECQQKYNAYVFEWEDIQYAFVPTLLRYNQKVLFLAGVDAGLKELNGEE